MDIQTKIIEDFKRDLPAILSGEDPTSDADYCGRCGMHFSSKRPHNDIDRTVCAEPGCGRWFAHGIWRATAHEGMVSVRTYKI